MRTIHRDIAGAFIFSKDHKVLLCKSVKGGVYKDEWIVPGGGIDEGETPLEAMKREIREEVGLDVNEAVIEPIDEVFTGESVKRLRDTGEKVLVKMKFYDFVVTYDRNASDIAVAGEDDVEDATWFSSDDVMKMKLSPPTIEFLKNINFVV